MQRVTLRQIDRGGPRHGRAGDGQGGGWTLCRGVVRQLVQGRYRCRRLALCRGSRDAQPPGAQIDRLSRGGGRREHPRLLAKGVWPRRERGPEILNWSWDAAIARLTVWWQLGEARASEFMDFDHAGRVVRSEAFYGK